MSGDFTDDILKKAKGYALRLFKLRPRSEGELRSKLKLKGYNPDVVEKIITDFTAWGFLNDEAFTRAWIQGRLKKYGIRRIQMELRDKGIAKELIQSECHHARDEYDEEETVRRIAEKRVRVYTQIEPLKRKKRVADYLIRRGFSLEVVNKVVRGL